MKKTSAEKHEKFKKGIKSKHSGRTSIPIDWNKVDQLLEAGCLGSEVAAYLGVSKETFYNRTQIEKGIEFSIYSHEKKEKGNSLLKAKQFQMAMNGDRTMAIWLGKQRLGQREKIDQRTEVEITQKAIIQCPENGRRQKKDVINGQEANE